MQHILFQLRLNIVFLQPMNILLGPKGLQKGWSIMKFVDSKLDGECSMEAFRLTLKLALTCTKRKQQRPSMEQVIVRLQGALEISFRAKASLPS